MSVEENVAFGLKVRSAAAGHVTRSRRVREFLEQFEIASLARSFHATSPAGSASASRWPAP